LRIGHAGETPAARHPRRATRSATNPFEWHAPTLRLVRVNLYSKARPRRVTGNLLSLCLLILLAGCSSDSPNGPGDIAAMPEHDRRYGLYRLNPAAGGVELVYTSDNSLHRIHENPSGTCIVFREDFGDDVFHDSEICVINTDGTGYQRLTDNTWLDSYPCWSPDGSNILFLSWPDYPDNTLDIFVMDADGSNVTEVYDSGYHDADCDWVGSRIVFTRQSQVWIMEDDGTNATQVTDYERGGEQGEAGLPFGDYDPRLNPAGTLICFDRMVDDEHPSGNWDFYTVSPDGTGEKAITGTGWQQFMAEWSHAGDRLLFTVAARNGDGVYDMYTMNADGSDQSDITPANWPSQFLCSHGIFSHDDSEIYFVGEWWEEGQ
jgi:Tol biopolymer transport system component